MFGVTDYDVARRMTLREYNVRMRGYVVSLVEREYLAHVTAFAHRAAMATNKKGEFVYRSLHDVFDKEKRLREILGESSAQVNQQLIQIARNLQAYRKEKEDDG